MAATITQPTRVDPATGGDDVTHYYCCDPNIAMCGLDLTNHAYVDDDEEDGDDCRLCAYIDDENLPCIVELLGHRRLAGRVREVQLAGAGFLRLDIPPTDGHEAQTQLISPSSVYALHPTTEAIATAAAARCRPEPVARWELEPRRTVVDDTDDPYDPDPF